MSDRQFNDETKCLHSGYAPDALTGARAVPIYQSNAFAFDEPEHASQLLNLQSFGNVHSGTTNPTVSVLEQRMAALEGGKAALAVASGMSARAVALLNLLKSGDELVAATPYCGDTHQQLAVSFQRFGIVTRFVDPNDLNAFERAINTRTRAIFAESLGGPTLSVLDIAAVADIAHRHHIPLLVDNTHSTPYLCKPIQHGADVVIHSASQYLGGHGNALGGVLVESGQFNWNNGLFNQLTEPSALYPDISFFDAFPDFAFTMMCRYETSRQLGPALSPMNAFLILQGLETLHVRMQRHCENALAVARFLNDHPHVTSVHYPGLSEHPDHALSQKYMPRGQSSVVSFGIEGGRASALLFIKKLQIHSHVNHLGDAKSLVLHPESSTHSALSPEQLQKAGVHEGMLRVGVGLESIDDILWDLDQALRYAAR